MKHFYLLLFCSLIVFTSCSSGSGADPHLTIEEVQEITEIYLVGKWKIRRTTLGAGKAIPANKMSCNVEAIEFFDDGSYLLSLNVPNDDGESLRIFRGSYVLNYTTATEEIQLESIYLMDDGFVLGASTPEAGSVASINEIDLSDSAISFAIQFGVATSGICDTSNALALSGDKETPVAPASEVENNHSRITQEWRLQDISASISGQTSTAGEAQNICLFIEGEYDDRCEGEEFQAAGSNCDYASTITLLFSDYGTYLFTYYGASNQVLSEDLGEWRWRTDTTTPYTSFDVKNEGETFEESGLTITVNQISDSTLILQESTQEIDDEGEEFTLLITYIFQLVDLPYQPFDCSNLN